jgi:hypothetical protein
MEALAWGDLIGTGGDPCPMSRNGRRSLGAHIPLDHEKEREGLRNDSNLAITLAFGRKSPANSDIGGLSDWPIALHRSEKRRQA